MVHAMAHAKASACQASNAATAFRLARTRLTDFWRTVKEDLFNPYRPELHYMRGPGPKWRQKHARIDLFDDWSGIAPERAALRVAFSTSLDESIAESAIGTIWSSSP